VIVPHQHGRQSCFVLILVFAWHELPVAAPGIGSRPVAGGPTIGGVQRAAYPPKPGPGDRVADIHAAFTDPGIAAVIASTGGDDQITVLPHLDAGLLRAHPKPFFGYSDSTRLLAYLAGLGIVGYYGGSVMADRCVAPAPEYAGGVLFLETSKELPSATEVYRMLRCMGERDLLGQFASVLLGRAKAWSSGHPAPPAERDAYQAGQRAAVLRAGGVCPEGHGGLRC
jgi:muramoyltetrapeptide carboxypeptidase LdcA involved in peptidoglycan recycling